MIATNAEQNFTAVIPSIGRETLHRTIRSCQQEGIPSVVVFDGPESWRSLDYAGCKTYILGRQFGGFGAVACNVGAAMAQTKYVSFIGDDDSYLAFAGSRIRQLISKRPGIDVWIPGILLPNGEIRCLKNRSKTNDSINVLDVSHPIISVYCVASRPMKVTTTRANDFNQLASLYQDFRRFEWIGSPMIRVKNQPETGHSGQKRAA